MSDAISFTSGSGEIEATEDELRVWLERVTQPSEETKLQAMDEQIDRLRFRADKGVDVDGQTFASYNRAYAKAREKKGLSVSPPDLRVSGRLLDSLEAGTDGPATATITITDAEAAVYGIALNEGSGRFPRRRWFDTSRKDLELIAEALERDVD